MIRNGLKIFGIKSSQQSSRWGLLEQSLSASKLYKSKSSLQQFAASSRINGLWEEVRKQKELERILQKRYRDLAAEMQRIHHLMDGYRVQSQKQKEIAAEKRALELAEAAAVNQATGQISDDSKPSEELGSAMPIDPPHDENPEQNMDVDSEKEQTIGTEERELPINEVSGDVDSVVSSDSIKENQTVDQQTIKDDGFANVDAMPVSSGAGEEVKETPTLNRDSEKQTGAGEEVNEAPTLNGDSEQQTGIADDSADPEQVQN